MLVPLWGLIQSRTFCHIARNMKGSVRTYTEAIAALNSLQGNALVLRNACKQPSHSGDLMLSSTRDYLAMLKMDINRLDSLNVIHVAGTKGKGSTCSLIDALLTARGVRTGLFTSPHLQHVRERIRLGGAELCEREFARYFSEVYDKLLACCNGEMSAMPGYFQFLTLLAYHVFLKERVECAIMEVGIGGEYDCTNVVQNPRVCVVTQLDLDHTALLGSTLQEIAHAKSGIFKRRSIAITTDRQEPYAMDVLRARSVQLDCPLCVAVASSFTALQTTNHVITLNAALALHVVDAWLKRSKNASYIPATELLSVPSLSADDSSLLEQYTMPGRFQTVQKTPITYFVDGAHTPRSIKECGDWFACHSRSTHRLLVFTCTADRDPATLLPLLSQLDFSLAVFCTTQRSAHPLPSTADDNLSFSVSLQSQLLRARECADAWPHSFIVLPSVLDALDCVREFTQQHGAQRTDVLVTGSLYLCGAVLGIIT